MAVARTLGFTDMPLRGLHTNTDTSAYTLTRDDSGIIFINSYTTGSCTYTLPACADGKGTFFMFYLGTSGASASIVITSPTSNTLNCSDDALATTLTSGHVAGSWCLVIGDGTYWYVMECNSDQWTNSG